MENVAWPADRIEAMRLSLGLSDRELCIASKLDQKTWRTARKTNQLTWATLKKLLDGIAATIADPRDGPTFPFAPGTMSRVERRELAEKAEAAASTSKRPAGERFKRLAAQLRAESKIFSSAVVAWLQLQWALEISFREAGLDNSAISALPKGHKLPVTEARARDVALFLCVEVFGTPQVRLAAAAGMTEASASAAIGRARDLLKMNMHLSRDPKFDIAGCLILLKRRAAQFPTST